MDKRVKKKNNSLAKYVIFSLSMIVVFTGVMIVMFCKYQVVPDELIRWFYTVFGGEILSCCLIKLLKLKGEGNE